jgi:hypothetical protein
MKVYIVTGSGYSLEDGSAIVGVFADREKAREFETTCLSNSLRYQSARSEFRKAYYRCGDYGTCPKPPEHDWHFFDTTEHEVIQ